MLYLRYATMWAIIWTVITLTTQLPFWELQSNALALPSTAVSCLSSTAEIGNSNLILMHTIIRAIGVNLLCGVFWSSISFWMHSLISRQAMRKVNINIRKLIYRSSFTVALVSGLLEAILFGFPLAVLCIVFVKFNFGPAMDCPEPFVSWTNIMIECFGIILGFLISTLTAGRLAPIVYEPTNKE